MRYWWVNQNQTFRHEIEGGYLWSPKRNKNGHRNPFYEFMREVAPGDIVFSFFDTCIAALGIVKYAPMTLEGNGLQSVYLTEISSGLASTLFALIGSEAHRVADVGDQVREIERDSPAPERDIEEWERRVEAAIGSSAAIPETERTALVQARRGQALFRDNVRSIERACRITRVERMEHLIASHIRPWRDSSNEQRLDGENGLLTPTVDHLFDKGFISFEDNGRLIVAPVADPISLRRMGIDGDAAVNVGDFSQGQQRHLDFHRENVLRMARGIAKGERGR